MDDLFRSQPRRHLRFPVPNGLGHLVDFAHVAPVWGKLHARRSRRKFADGTGEIEVKDRLLDGLDPRRSVASNEFDESVFPPVWMEHRAGDDRLGFWILQHGDGIVGNRVPLAAMRSQKRADFHRLAEDSDGNVDEMATQLEHGSALELPPLRAVGIGHQRVHGGPEKENIPEHILTNQVFQGPHPRVVAPHVADLKQAFAVAGKLDKMVQLRHSRCGGLFEVHMAAAFQGERRLAGVVTDGGFYKDKFAGGQKLFGVELPKAGGAGFAADRWILLGHADQFEIGMIPNDLELPLGVGMGEPEKPRLDAAGRRLGGGFKSSGGGETGAQGGG